jgi:hypothetical protein
MGTTRCDATFTFAGALTLFTTFGGTSWSGVSEIVRIDDITFTVDDLTVDATGGFLCVGLELAASLFAELLSQAIDPYADQLFALIPEQLEGLYVCPVQ